MTLTDTQNHWLSALEDGNYRQVKGYLRVGSTVETSAFCCFGVGCDIRDSDRWEDSGSYPVGLSVPLMRWREVVHKKPPYHTSIVPPKIIKWLGFKSRCFIGRNAQEN